MQETGCLFLIGKFYRNDAKYNKRNEKHIILEHIVLPSSQLLYVRLVAIVCRRKLGQFFSTARIWNEKARRKWRKKSSKENKL